MPRKPAGPVCRGHIYARGGAAVAGGARGRRTAMFLCDERRRVVDSLHIRFHLGKLYDYVLFNVLSLVYSLLYSPPTRRAVRHKQSPVASSVHYHRHGTPGMQDAPLKVVLYRAARWRERSRIF